MMGWLQMVLTTLNEHLICWNHSFTSLKLAPSIFHIFTKLEKRLVGKRLLIDDSVLIDMKHYLLNEMTVDFYITATRTRPMVTKQNGGYVEYIP